MASGTNGEWQGDRDEVSARCRWLDLLELDDGRNKRGETRINDRHRGCQPTVIATDEELMVANHTATVLGL